MYIHKSIHTSPPTYTHKDLDTHIYLHVHMQSQTHVYTSCACLAWEVLTV